MARSGCSIRAISIVGTQSVAVTRSVSMSSSTRAGSKEEHRDVDRAGLSDPSTPIAQPAVWNIGIGLR